MIQLQYLLNLKVKGRTSWKKTNVQVVVRKYTCPFCNELIDMSPKLSTLGKTDNEQK